MHMPEIYDLHCHSTASDGALSPAELVHRAKEFGVTSLALTDHDTVAGLKEAQNEADLSAIRLIPGIELSTSWKNKCFHIVGLGINPAFPALAEATRNLQIMRFERAQKIADKLEKKGISGAMEAVNNAVGPEGMITRSHFADFLLAHCHVSTQQEAFDRYLGAGKPAYAPTLWAEMEQAIQWITESGGVAVLAHPLRYKLTGSWINRLLSAFKEVGGAGIEVVTGRYNKDEIHVVANYARRYDLAGSVGSDFHSPDLQWVELGRLAPLPENIKPIWELLHLPENL